MWKQKTRNSVIQILKNELKNNDFSHLITKARFQIRYVFEDKKIYSSVVSYLFPTQRKSLPVGIIRTDTLWIILFYLKYKENMGIWLMTDQVMQDLKRWMLSVSFMKCVWLLGQRIHAEMDKMYEMDRTYQKFYTHLANDFVVLFLLC